MKANSILETIGNTPHIRVAKLFPDAEVWVKSERANPGGSIKDRIGLAMIEAAERDGSLKPGGVIVEPTSGNTGIGLAMAAAVKGDKLILVMPESMSLERRRLMLAYGATFDLTPREKGMKGAIERAIELVETTPGAWMPQQFENEANIDVHVRTTGPEILNDFKDTPIDALITGVGTGGHITGVAQFLKQHWPNLKVYAVEPELSPVISGGQPGPHPIQGIGAGFVPPILDTDVYDEVITVDAADAFDLAPEGAVYVVDERMRASSQGKAGWRNCNLRTTFTKIVTRAGLTAWPRLFHNLRSSRQTELDEKFPSHVVCDWLGTSEDIARKHYLQTTDDHFARAASDDSEAKQNPKQLAAVLGRSNSQPKLTDTENAGKSEDPRYCAKRKVVREGFEPPTKGL